MRIVSQWIVLSTLLALICIVESKNFVAQRIHDAGEEVEKDGKSGSGEGDNNDDDSDSQEMNDESSSGESDEEEEEEEGGLVSQKVQRKTGRMLLEVEDKPMPKMASRTCK